MYKLIMHVLSYLIPLIPIIPRHTLSIDSDFSNVSDLLEGVASVLLAVFFATQQHKFSGPDQVLLLYLFAVFIRPLLKATFSFETFYSLLGDNIYPVATAKVILTGVVFVFGEKIFLAIIQHTNDDPATYGYFGALNSRLELGYNVWALCLGGSPSIAEASPPPTYMSLQQTHVPFIPPSPKRPEMV